MLRLGSGGVKFFHIERREQVSESSVWIQPEKFSNPTDKVSESNRKSFRIHPEKFPRTSFRIQPEKFPNPTGKFPNPTGKVSEDKFPNPTGKVSEDKFPNPTGKVSESNRKSFRIQPEKFPNPPGKVSEYKFPNTTGKVSEDNGLVTESQLPEYKSYRIQPEKFPNPTGKFPNPPGKVSESNRKVSEYKFPNPTRKVSEYNGDLRNGGQENIQVIDLQFFVYYESPSLLRPNIFSLDLVLCNLFIGVLSASTVVLVFAQTCKARAFLRWGWCDSLQLALCNALMSMNSLDDIESRDELVRFNHLCLLSLPLHLSKKDYLSRTHHTRGIRDGFCGRQAEQQNINDSGKSLTQFVGDMLTPTQMYASCIWLRVLRISPNWWMVDVLNS